jgi:hypothetical protein
VGRRDARQGCVRYLKIPVIRVLRFAGKPFYGGWTASKA